MNKPRKEVQNLILMLSSAVFIAFLIVVALVYYFGSSGTYLLRDVLVSPEALKKISFTESKEEEGRFIFNKIEFVRAESQGRGWGRYAVSKQSYAAFYDAVASERSLPQISDEIIEQFDRVVPSTLTIFVQARDNAGSMQTGGIFQQVEFLDNGDIFRIQLRDREATWVYFHQSGIYDKVMELFAPPMGT